MRAIMVARVEEDQVYFDIDAGAEDKDGILVRPDSSMVKVDLFDFADSCGKLLKIQTTRFHKFFWNGINYKNSELWENTFIKKTRKVSDGLLSDLELYSALGKNRKKIDNMDKKIKRFKKSVDDTKRKQNTKTLENSLETKSEQPCCDNKMVKFDISDFSFGSVQARKEAWAAMNLLRHLEEDDQP